MLLKFRMQVHIWVLSFKNIYVNVYMRAFAMDQDLVTSCRGAHSFQKRNILSNGSHDFKFRAFITISINSNYYYYYISNYILLCPCHLVEKFILT